jgi:ATP-binding cassette subfamily F protein uup
MSLLRLKNISLHFGEKPLLDNISLTVHAKDRIAVLGRNGVGKSSLFKLLQGHISADQGQIERMPHLRIAELPQTVPRHLTGCLFDFVAKNLPEDNQLYLVEKVISQVGLDPNAELNALSGGQIRRALLATALVNDPDILLLDEPTNHLDLDSIQWLENFINKSNKTIIFVTHDRVFLQKIATRIVEIDRGKIIDWSGDYEHFLLHKEQLLVAEDALNAQFDKKLAQEEVWIRQGIQARRTRNEGRVRALEQMRREGQARRARQGQLRLEQQDRSVSGKQVLIAENISLLINDKTIIHNFSTLIERGDKVGIIGPNGCGKTTLINALLGKIPLTQGQVKHGTQLKIAYFDQHRSILDPASIVQDNIAGGHHSVTINGVNKHVIGYLQDFLFTPEKARSKVSMLSGGECNRLLLAKLFAEPSNVLVLDEPTNDLDIESLQLLEEYLANYQGTVLLVSHDRALLNNVVTSTLVFEGQGVIKDYVGGYEDWLRQTSANKVPLVTKKPNPEIKPIKEKALSYKEKQELSQLPDQISALEKKIEVAQQLLADPAFYQQAKNLQIEKQNEISALHTELETKFARWEVLLDK